MPPQRALEERQRGGVATQQGFDLHRVGRRECLPGGSGQVEFARRDRVPRWPERLQFWPRERTQILVDTDQAQPHQAAGPFA